MLFDGLALQAHTPVNIIDFAVCAFLDAHKILRHGSEADWRQVIAGLDQHHSSADSQIKQELAHSQIKVRLAQHAEHLVVIHIQRHLRL